MSGSGISWAICMSAPRSRQITMPLPHQSVFTGRMPFLSPNQQHQSTEGSITSKLFNFLQSSKKTFGKTVVMSLQARCPRSYQNSNDQSLKPVSEMPSLHANTSDNAITLHLIIKNGKNVTRNRLRFTKSSLSW